MKQDAFLVSAEGGEWEITWVFGVTQGVSQRLVDDLKAADIKVIVNNEVK